jgi:hypothetical protein
MWKQPIFNLLAGFWKPVAYYNMGYRNNIKILEVGQFGAFQNEE